MSRCPDCNKEIISATGVNTDDTPSDGAISICDNCRSISVFTGNGLDVRRPTPDELDLILANPEVRRTIAIATAAETMLKIARRNLS